MMDPTRSISRLSGASYCASIRLEGAGIFPKEVPWLRAFERDGARRGGRYRARGQYKREKPQAWGCARAGGTAPRHSGAPYAALPAGRYAHATPGVLGFICYFPPRATTTQNPEPPPREHQVASLRNPSSSIIHTYTHTSTPGLSPSHCTHPAHTKHKESQKGEEPLVYSNVRISSRAANI